TSVAGGGDAGAAAIGTVAASCWKSKANAMSNAAHRLSRFKENAGIVLPLLCRGVVVVRCGTIAADTGATRSLLADIPTSPLRVTPSTAQREPPSRKKSHTN